MRALHTPRPPRYTPWGQAQHSHQIIPGVWTISTASHGGIWLSSARLEHVPAYMQRTWAGTPWFEEDVDWCIVFCVFEAELRQVEDEYVGATLKSGQHRNTLKNYRPDDFERFYGVTLGPGESQAKDEAAFYAAHAQDWLCIAALGDWKEGVPKGFVEVIATQGGRRGAGTPERTFLVPATEYADRRFAFIVDPNRHAEVTYRIQPPEGGWKKECSLQDILGDCAKSTQEVLP